MKKTVILFAALSLAASIPTSFAADVTGKITLNGAPPPEIPIDFSANPECGSLVTGQPTSRRYIVGKDHGLKDVLVYVSKGLEGKTFTPPSAPVVLEQSGCMYQPYVLALMPGQKLQIKNSDPVLHNISCEPKVPGNEAFNITQTKQDQINEVTFAKPEIMVRVNCFVHKWMLAYIAVVDNPFFAITDADGQFKIANLPPGEYTLTAFHQKAHFPGPGVTQTLKVEGSAPVTVNFTVDVSVAN